MASTHKERAERVIAAFKENLSPEVRDRITESDYATLGLMIREAMSDCIADVAEQFEATLKAVRSEIERPPLDL